MQDRYHRPRVDKTRVRRPSTDFEYCLTCDQAFHRRLGIAIINNRVSLSRSHGLIVEILWYNELGSNMLKPLNIALRLKFVFFFKKHKICKGNYQSLKLTIKLFNVVIGRN